MCPWPSLARFLSALWALSWWPLSPSLPPNMFSPSAWGAAFIRIIFLVPPMVTIHRSLPLRGFQPRFFGGAPAWRITGIPYSSRSLVFWRFSGAIIFTSNHLTGYVGWRSCITATLLLFNGQLSLVFSLLSVGGEEEINV